MTNFLKIMVGLDTHFKAEAEGLGIFEGQGPYRVTRVYKDSSESAVMVTVFGVDPGMDLHLHAETWMGEAWLFYTGKVTCQVTRLPEATSDFLPNPEHKLPNGF